MPSQNQVINVTNIIILPNDFYDDGIQRTVSSAWLFAAVKENLAGTQMMHSGKKTRSFHHIYITNFLLIFFFLFFLSSASDHSRPNKMFLHC